MKKLFITATLMGSLNAACLDVITLPLKTHCTMRLLEQDLGSTCGNLPFNSDFDWDSLTKKSVEEVLERLADPSMYEMLGLWRQSETLGLLSTNIIILLNQNTSLSEFAEKKKRMKEITTKLNDFWQQVPLF